MGGALVYLNFLLVQFLSVLDRQYSIFRGVVRLEIVRLRRTECHPLPFAAHTASSLILRLLRLLDITLKPLQIRV